MQHSFTVASYSRETAPSLTPAGDSWRRSVSDKSSVFTATVLAYSVLGFSFAASISPTVSWLHRYDYVFVLRITSLEQASTPAAVLQPTESWAGPGNKATYYRYLSYVFHVSVLLFPKLGK